MARIDPMARRTNEDAAEAAEPTAAAGPAKDDVLVYIDRHGAIAMLWNTALPRSTAGDPGIRARIPQQHRVRLEPGLSFCPGAQWERVQETPSYRRASEDGALRPIAGQGGALVAELARIKPRALATMVDRSAHVPSLQRLQEIEQAMDSPRLDVLEAIEVRLDVLRVEVARSDRKRRQQRRVHRGQAPNGARPRR